jgi:hypothetical protein
MYILAIFDGSAISNSGPFVSIEEARVALEYIREADSMMGADLEYSIVSELPELSER